MTNIVDLEQLDFRDQLIKDYIDNNTGGGSGGGSSDYLPLRMVLTRQGEKVSSSGNDEQHLYLGFPESTDITDYSLLYMRGGTVRQRNKRDEIPGRQNKWKGLHQVWKAPSKDRIPLIVIVFKDKSTSDFTKDGYDYYEIGGNWDGNYYNMLDFINQGFADDILGIEISDMMRHKRGGIIVLKNDTPISGHIRFQTNYCDNLSQWRIQLY